MVPLKGVKAAKSMFPALGEWGTNDYCGAMSTETQPEIKTTPEVDAVITKTIEYLAAPCVVGHEQYFLGYLLEDFKKLGLKTIRHDGLLEVHGSKPYSAILTAHIDRHGLISIGHGEYVYAAQYIKEIKYGQNNRNSQKEIAAITARFEGERVFAYDDTTGKNLGAGLIKTCDPFLLKGDALFEVDSMNELDLGTPLAYARTGRVEGKFFKGQLDNAISLGVIHTLFKNGFAGTALLSTEEEIGKSWIHLAGWLLENGIRTQDIIVLDTSPFVDPTPVDDGMLIFRNRDMTAPFNAGLTDAMRTMADRMKLKYCFKDEILIAQGKTTEQLGSTELGKLIRGTNGQWGGATVQIPTIMYHTSNETTSIAAINNYYAFLWNILMGQPLQFGIGIEPLRVRK